ncbi:hypothetical protein PR048_026703 [Dryococelus australis]|uniref:VWFD domain-containing protein n=1 Tax=Dryococelus australis TaxID=614101 RepID=A0ABQ9GM40_9NEOP|nr:hypothetical protein PR048_026703 [Dryococelus australis]
MCVLCCSSSKAALGTVEETLEVCKRRLSLALTSALLTVSELARIPEVIHLTDIATFILYKVQWAWQYYEAADSLKEGLHNAVGNVNTLLADMVQALGQSAVEEGGWQAGTLVVRPGLVEFAQQLPVDWPGFDETPRFQQLTLHPLPRSQRLIEEPTASLPASLRSTTALLVGGRRFVTFDGKFFDFVGNCSYVLAADLEDSQYSVFITYRGKEGSAVRKSLTVVVDERLVELGEDGQVRVGGKKTELPAAAGTSALLWRRGDSVVVDALRHGLRLRCDLRRDACSLQVGDRHRGKVSGLLGAFHGDVANHARRWRLSLDTTTGDKSVPTVTIGSLRWSVISPPRLAEQAHTNVMGVCRYEQVGPEESRSPTEEPQLVNACDDLFRSLESPLRPCYGMVDPSPFYAMCLVDATEGPCPSSTVYLAQCRAAGVRVDLPPECGKFLGSWHLLSQVSVVCVVRCALQDGSMLHAGEGKVLDPDRPEAADVVFVVERTSCLARLGLRDLTEKLYAGMALRGLEEVRYAVVSFGPGQPPESHTCQGRLWSSHRSARDTLRT